MRGFVVWVTVGLVLLHLLLRVGIGFGGGAPDLFVVALLVAARRMRVGGAAAFGFALGLLEDAFSALSFGANAFSMTVTGILGSRSRDLFVGDSLLFLFCYFGLGKWFREFLTWMVSDATARSAFIDRVVFEAPLAALYAAVVGIGVAYLVRGPAEGVE